MVLLLTLNQFGIMKSMLGFYFNKLKCISRWVVNVLAVGWLMY